MSLELQLFIIALEAALYPTLLAAVIILISQPNPKRLLGAYLVGGLIMSITAGCLIVYGLHHSGALDQGEGSGLSWAADVTLGGLVLLVAVAIARREDVKFAERRRAKRPAKPPDPEAADKEPWSQRILARGSTPLIFAVGIAVNVPGAAYLIALKDIAAADISAERAFALILEFNLIMFLLAKIPLAGLILAPEPTEARVKRFNAWLSRNSRRIATVVCAALGGFLIARGLINA